MGWHPKFSHKGASFVLKVTAHMLSVAAEYKQEKSKIRECKITSTDGIYIFQTSHDFMSDEVTVIPYNKMRLP
jgi:hypothetical protein